MKFSTFILASAILCTPLISQAKVSQVDNKKINIASHINSPKRGSSMKSVLLRFGKAKRISKSKGKSTSKRPRITRWDYGNFAVYFEKSKVIHTVVHNR